MSDFPENVRLLYITSSMSLCMWLTFTLLLDMQRNKVYHDNFLLMITYKQTMYLLEYPSDGKINLKRGSVALNGCAPP